MAEIYIKHCGICGKKFSTKYSFEMYCCEECKHTAKLERMHRWQKKNRCRKVRATSPGFLMNDILNDVHEPFKVTSRVSEHAREARERGMSYGEYMAFREGRL